MTGPTAHAIQSLFGDVPFESLEIGSADSEPWRSFANARADVARGDETSALRTMAAIAVAHGIEARHRVQAWHLVRHFGGRPPREIERDVLGVVVEVGIEGGQDLLAVYADRTAHYYNYSGAAVIWMRPDSSLDKSVDAVIGAARSIVNLVDPWNQPRRPPPANGNARLNILTPIGIHFGEGPINALGRDRSAGPLMAASIAMLAKMTSLPRAKSNRVDAQN